MESCTSGFIASLLTDTEGASEVFRGSFVTYSNEAKILCGVPEEVIRVHGVYSKETAIAMATTCRGKFGTDVGIGVTGTFGNVDPANADSTPGIVYAAISDGRQSIQNEYAQEPGNHRQRNLDQRDHKQNDHGSCMNDLNHQSDIVTLKIELPYCETRHEYKEKTAEKIGQWLLKHLESFRQ